MVVTRLAWMAQRLVSSKRPTMYASAASWRARTARRKRRVAAGRIAISYLLSGQIACRRLDWDRVLYVRAHNITGMDFKLARDSSYDVIDLIFDNQDHCHFI